MSPPETERMQYDLLITNQNKMSTDILQDAKQHNISALIFPLYQSVPYQLSLTFWQDLLHRNEQPEHYLAVSSTYCAQLLLQIIKQLNFKSSNIQVLAPGSSTANLLRQHFANVTSPNKHQAAGLADIYPSNSHITLLTQAKGRMALEFAAKQKNSNLERINLYRRVPLHLNHQQLTILRDAKQVIIASTDSLFRYRLLVDAPGTIITLYPRIKTIADNLQLKCDLVSSYFQH